MTLFILTVTILLLSIILMTVSSILAKKTIFDREKNSPYECGFDPKSLARLPFSLRFFLIAVIFLIFDVEITLIFPMSFILKTSNMFSWIKTTLIFLFFLVFGLYYEWKQGALEWS